MHFLIYNLVKTVITVICQLRKTYIIIEHKLFYYLQGVCNHGRYLLPMVMSYITLHARTYVRTLNTHNHLCTRARTYTNSDTHTNTYAHQHKHIHIHHCILNTPHQTHPTPQPTSPT